jgi:hypothetical protein
MTLFSTSGAPCGTAGIRPVNVWLGYLAPKIMKTLTALLTNTTTSPENRDALANVLGCTTRIDPKLVAVSGSVPVPPARQRRCRSAPRDRGKCRFDSARYRPQTASLQSRRGGISRRRGSDGSTSIDPNPPLKSPTRCRFRSYAGPRLQSTTQRRHLLLERRQSNGSFGVVFEQPAPHVG